MPMDTFFNSYGIKMKIERAGEIVMETIGLPNHEKATGKAFIGFRPETDVRTGDVIVNPAGDRFLSWKQKPRTSRRKLSKSRRSTKPNRNTLQKKVGSLIRFFTLERHMAL